MYPKIKRQQVATKEYKSVFPGMLMNNFAIPKRASNNIMYSKKANQTAPVLNNSRNSSVGAFVARKPIVINREKATIQNSDEIMIFIHKGEPVKACSTFQYKYPLPHK